MFAALHKHSLVQTMVWVKACLGNLTLRTGLSSGLAEGYYWSRFFSCFFSGAKVENQLKLLQSRLPVKSLVQNAPRQPRHHPLRLPNYRVQGVRLHFLPNRKLNPDPALPSNLPSRLRQILVNKPARPSEVPRNHRRVKEPSVKQPPRGLPARTSLQSPRLERPVEAPLCRKRRFPRSPPVNPLHQLRYLLQQWGLMLVEFT